MSASKTICNFFCLLILTIGALMMPNQSAAQKKTYVGSPVKKEKLVKVLRSKQYQAREIVKIIGEHGVDFQLTPAAQAEIVGAGARPEVIEAVRVNYRPAVTKTATASKNIVNAADAYQNLIDQALNQYDNAKNTGAAISTLQRAVKLLPSNSRAYQLLGYMNLYGFKNFVEAEYQMREAIKHGGSAVFRVFHDHNGTFTSGCAGSLYVAKDSVRFEADNNIHTFQTLDSNIKTVKTNSKFRRLLQVKNGSFKVVLKNDEDDDDKKFSFAPLTNKIDESEMIIRLIGKN